MSAKAEPLTVADLRRRPTITVQEYARFVGVSKDTVYEAAARGELRHLKLGARILLPTAPILEALGYEVDGAGCGGGRE